MYRGGSRILVWEGHWQGSQLNVLKIIAARRLEVGGIHGAGSGGEAPISQKNVTS